MRKLRKKLINILLFLLLFILISFITTSSVENIMTDVMISNFKKKGVYRSDLSSENLKVYEVKGNETKSSFIKEDGIIYPGNKADILVSRKSMVGGPIIRGFLTFFAGGHAGLVAGDYDDYCLNNQDIEPSNTTIIETTALKDKDEALIFERDYLANDEYFYEVIGLRVKMTDEESDEVLSNAYSYINDPYNYSFVFNTKKTKYCSDLVSESFKSIGKNLNKDGFTTSIYDLIVSNCTFISYYHIFIDDIKYIYYLS